MLWLRASVLTQVLIKYTFKFRIRGPLELFSVHSPTSSDLLLQSSDLPGMEIWALGLNGAGGVSLENMVLLLPSSVKSFSQFHCAHSSSNSHSGSDICIYLIDIQYLLLRVNCLQIKSSRFIVQDMCLKNTWELNHWARALIVWH